MDVRYWVRRGGIWGCVLVLALGMGPWVASARAQSTNAFFGSSSGTFIPSGGRPPGATYYVPGYPGYYFGHGYDFGRGFVGPPVNYAGSYFPPGGSYYVSPSPGGGMPLGTFPAYSSGFGVPPMPTGGYPPYSGGLFP